MNLVPTTTLQLPAHLLALKSQGASNIRGGISLGEGHPRISIRQNRFRLIEASGEEEVWNNLSIELVILDGNPNVTKRYFAKAYDPSATEAVPPSCASDDGKIPNAGVPLPQSTNCATCPQNVWGSKVNDNGKATRACGDSKRLAVVLAEDIGGTIFELSVPAVSLKDLADVMDKLDKTGVPVQGVKFEVFFDTSATFPKLVFKPKAYISDAEVALVQQQLSKPAVMKAIGMDKVNARVFVPQQVVQTAPPASRVEQLPPAIQPAAPVAVLHGGMTDIGPSGKPKRVRRTKAEMEAAARGDTQNNAQPGLFDAPQGTANAAAATQVNPVPTDASVDALLDGIFG